jgi:putative zinc finger protein
MKSHSIFAGKNGVTDTSDLAHNEPRARHAIVSRTEPVLMSCRTAVDLIPDYLSRSISTSADMALHSHIDGCADCAAILRTYEKTIELTRSFLHRRDLAIRPHGNFSCQAGGPDSFQRIR